jgi:hypothetical protein
MNNYKNVNDSSMPGGAIHGNNPSGMESLSAEYFGALYSACPPEEIDQLLSLPDLHSSSSSNSNESSITTEQAIQYLNAVVSLSPTFQLANGTATSSSARQQSSSSNNTATSATITTKPAASSSSKLFANVRNAVAILAINARHEISSSGILSKLKSIASDNPHAQVEFLQCCILASHYRYARNTFPLNQSLQLQLQPQSFVQAQGSSNSNNSNTNSNGTIHTELFLRYHYLRGIIYYASDEITEAIAEWNKCIAAPAHAMSEIIACAWKKMILGKCLMLQYDDEEEICNCKGASVSVDAKVSLMEHLMKLPNGTSAAVSRFFKKGASRADDIEEYQKFVERFVQNDLTSFMEELNSENVNNSAAGSDGAAGSGKWMQVLQEDGHLGMVNRLIPVMRWRQFRSLSKIYTAIPLEKLSHILGLGQGQGRGQGGCSEFLMEAAMKQNLHPNPDPVGPAKGWNCTSTYRAPVEFTFDDEEGVVYFDVEGKEEDLEGRIEKCMALAKRVKDLDVALASSSKYQMNVHKNGGEGKKGAAETGRSVVELA